MRFYGFVLISLFAVKSMATIQYSSTLYEQKSERKKPIYTAQYLIEDGSSTAVFKDMEGNVAFEEKAVLNGDEIVRIDINQKQTNQTASIEVKDGKIIFSKTTDGKTKTDEEKLEKPFVMSSNFNRFVKSNWDKLKAGERLEFRFGSWDRMETVGFRIQKIKEEEGNIQLKMEASSGFIRAIINPLFFTYNSEGSKIVAYDGRVSPKRLVKNDYKDLDAEVVYQYVEPKVEKPAPPAKKKIK